MTSPMPACLDRRWRVSLLYVNHRGEAAVRHVYPIRLYFGTSEWHPEPQWLIEAFDVDREARRTFALQAVKSWTPSPAPKAAPEEEPR